MSRPNCATAELAPEVPYRLLDSGRAGLAAMIQAIDTARQSVRLQTYILRDGEVARRMRTALIAARTRGVDVRVLVDALGSYALPAGFFDELRVLGGQYRLFNPLHPRRFLYRNHRKSLVCDERTAIIGGFNVADEYDGDGVMNGWRDLGLELAGPLVAPITQAFDRLYSLADFHPRHFARLRRATQRERIAAPPAELLFGGPGRGANPLKRALLRDLGKARHARIMSPYFLPTWRLRRRLMRLARRGARVQLLLPGISDVPLAQYAARAVYGKLLRAGVEIWEYQPQILHGKLIVTDTACYVGSANFNTRSLHIDYELMLRIAQPALIAEADALFAADLGHSRRIDLEQWRRQRRGWQRIGQRLAYLLMARLDPLVAGWLWKGQD